MVDLFYFCEKMSPTNLLLKIFRILLRIAYSREPSIRKFCDSKWRAKIINKSPEFILRKMKLILSHCSYSTLRVICKRLSLSEFDNNQVIILIGDILKIKGQNNLQCFKYYMRKYESRIRKS